MKVLYINGILEEHPKPFRPLPPLDSGAPISNMFRLIEELSKDSYDLDISAISGISSEMLNYMNIKWPLGSYRGNYCWVKVPAKLRKLSHILVSNYIISGILNRLIGVYSLQSSYYLLKIYRNILKIKPDIVVLDAGGQFIKGLCNLLPSSVSMLFFCRGESGYITRSSMHLCKAVLVTNNKFSEWVTSVNINVKDIFIIPNSLDEKYLKLPKNQGRFNNNEKRIIFAGRLHPVKGIEFLIKAFSKVVKVFPEARLVIVGKAVEVPKIIDQNLYTSKYEDEIKLLAKNILPKNSCIWMGWLEQADLINEYQKAYMAVYPSVWVEAFGMVALEAMALGLPVIASKRPGFQTLLSEECGILIDDPMDIEALGEAMVKLLSDQNYAERLGFNAYHKARKYSVEKAAKEFINIIQSFVKN
ncbi:MAG: glycosyltransferase family 4 protein [Thermodesulfobacteriota bacterium]